MCSHLGEGAGRVGRKMLPGSRFCSSAWAENYWLSADRARKKPDFYILFYLEWSSVTLTGLVIEAYLDRQSCRLPGTPTNPHPHFIPKEIGCV